MSRSLFIATLGGALPALSSLTTLCESDWESPFIDLLADEKNNSLIKSRYERDHSLMQTVSKKCKNLLEEKEKEASQRPKTMLLATAFEPKTDAMKASENVVKAAQSLKKIKPAEPVKPLEPVKEKSVAETKPVLAEKKTEVVKKETVFEKEVDAKVEEKKVEVKKVNAKVEEKKAEAKKVDAKVEENKVEVKKVEEKKKEEMAPAPTESPAKEKKRMDAEKQKAELAALKADKTDDDDVLGNVLAQYGVKENTEAKKEFEEEQKEEKAGKMVVAPAAVPARAAAPANTAVAPATAVAEQKQAAPRTPGDQKKAVDDDDDDDLALHLPATFKPQAVDSKKENLETSKNTAAGRIKSALLQEDNADAPKISNALSKDSTGDGFDELSFHKISHEDVIDGSKGLKLIDVPKDDDPLAEVKKVEAAKQAKGETVPPGSRGAAAQEIETPKTALLQTKIETKKTETNNKTEFVAAKTEAKAEDNSPLDHESELVQNILQGVKDYKKEVATVPSSSSALLTSSLLTTPSAITDEDMNDMMSLGISFLQMPLPMTPTPTSFLQKASEMSTIASKLESEFAQWHSLSLKDARTIDKLLTKVKTAKDGAKAKDILMKLDAKLTDKIIKEMSSYATNGRNILTSKLSTTELESLVQVCQKSDKLYEEIQMAIGETASMKNLTGETESLANELKYRKEQEKSVKASFSWSLRDAVRNVIG